MSTPARIVDDMIISIAKAAKNPFAENTKQFKRAQAVLACRGKTVEAAKKKGADSWTVRYLVAHKLVTVAAGAA
jgi:hypothetical protein